MRILILLLILFFPSLAYSAPSTTVSITPAAVDATTITASDENTRNSAISTWANAHDHNDIDQTANTVAVGDAAAGNKTLQANNADTNKPFIRYDDTNNYWVLSNDGLVSDKITVLTGAAATLRDADNNTTIQVEKNVNEDIVRIGTAGTERWNMTATGERTMPTQPAFQAETAAGQLNIATGSDITVIFGTEIFDQGSDFATNTFTAPATGRYLLAFNFDMADIDTATTYAIKIITSNRTYAINFDPSKFSADITSGYYVHNSIIVDMDTSDTAYVAFNQAGGTQQTDINSTPGKFSGALLF